jgi:hypothetical protein
MGHNSILPQINLTRMGFTCTGCVDVAFSGTIEISPTLHLWLLNQFKTQIIKIKNNVIFFLINSIVITDSNQDLFGSVVTVVFQNVFHTEMYFFIF